MSEGQVFIVRFFYSKNRLLTLYNNNQKKTGVVMMYTEIRYDGENYEEIDDAGIQAGIEEIDEYFDKALKPFESQLSEHNGLVIVDIKKDFDDAEISFRNLPEDLVKQISTALTK